MCVCVLILLENYHILKSYRIEWGWAGTGGGPGKACVCMCVCAHLTTPYS